MAAPGAKDTLREHNHLRPYAAYRDSGVDWLGKVPLHWTLKKWRYCCRVTQGQVPPDDVLYRDRIMIAPNHIESGTGRILFTETAEEQGAASGKYLVKPGDIIYSKIRPGLNKACIATGHWLCSADMYPVAISTSEMMPRYLLYLILSEPFVRRMVDESMRVAMPKVNRETVADCPLLIPSLKEQQDIVRYLDEATARISGLVVKKERLIELLQEKRAALITQAVTRGLAPTVRMKDSGVEWLPEVPSHWDIKPNASLFQERDDRGRDDLPILEVSIVSGVRVRDFSDDKIEQRSEDLGVYKVARTGDIAFNKMRMWQGAVGTTPEDGFVSPDYVVARPGPETESAYYASLFRTPIYMAEVYRRSHGIVDDRNRLYWDDFKAIRSPFPPLSEQRAIVSFLDQEATKIDGLIARVRKAIERLKELRTALISAAVTGKIDVRAF